MNGIRQVTVAGFVLAWVTVGMAAEPLKWDALKDLPDAEGFAGCFAGVVYHQEMPFMVVVGGANFPDDRPWEGGKKVYYNKVYRYALGEEQIGEWEDFGEIWPERVAYGMSVSLPHRRDALFIGGKQVEKASGKERALRAVWLMRSYHGDWSAENVANLPVPLVEATAALVGKKVIVAGGVTNKVDGPAGGFEVVKKVFVLDTAPAVEEWKWEERSWPEGARGRMYAVSGAKGNKFYMFGGRDYASSEEEAEDRFSGLDFLRDCYELDVDANTWRRLADLPHGRSAAPANAVQIGASHFLMMGGVPVKFLHEQVAARPDKNGQGMEHPGFPRSMLAYDLLTDTWAEAGSVPEEIKVGEEMKSIWAPVTTPVVQWKNQIIIPTGEIKPGVRSPQVLVALVNHEGKNFGVVNWIVVGVYLLGMVGIGYWFMKRKAAASTEAYFRGGQHVPFWVAGLSIFATMLSALTFMGIPARAYQTDVTWYIGQLPILIVVPLVAMFYLPFFRKINLTSAYTYLELRFNLVARLIASASFIIFHIGRIAIVLYLPALALAAVSNIDVVAAILIIGVLCVIYTVMGGIEAVVWTDAIQAIVLMGGAILCLLLVVFRVDGGVGAVYEIAASDNKLFENLRWDNFDIHDGTTTAIVLFVAFFFNALVPYTSGQDVVQRYVTTRDVGEAKKSLWTTMWMSVFGSMIFFALGAAIYAFYKTHPAQLDPTLAKTDSILPFYIIQQLPIGVSGLIIAAIFAASQSTVSSSLNSIATAWIKDWDARLIRRKKRDKVYLKAAKIVVVLVGAIGIAVAVVMALSTIESAFKTFQALIGLAAGSLGGLFALGIFTKRAHGVPAVIGALCGFAAVAYLKYSDSTVSGLLYAFIGFGVCFVVGYVLSLVPIPTEAGRKARARRKAGKRLSIFG